MTESKSDTPIIIQRNETKQIQVTASKFNGHDFVNVRQFIDINGELRPTKLGMTFMPNDAQEIIDAIQAKLKLLPLTE